MLDRKKMRRESEKEKLRRNKAEPRRKYACNTRDGNSAEAYDKDLKISGRISHCLYAEPPGKFNKCLSSAIDFFLHFSVFSAAIFTLALMVFHHTTFFPSHFTFSQRLIKVLTRYFHPQNRKLVRLFVLLSERSRSRSPTHRDPSTWLSSLMFNLLQSSLYHALCQAFFIALKLCLRQRNFHQARNRNFSSLCTRTFNLLSFNACLCVFRQMIWLRRCAIS